MGRHQNSKELKGKDLPALDEYCGKMEKEEEEDKVVEEAVEDEKVGEEEVSLCSRCFVQRHHERAGRWRTPRHEHERERSQLWRSFVGLRAFADVLSWWRTGVE